MGQKDKFYSIQTGGHGFDDIGWAQTGGSITSVAKYGAGKWAKYAMITASAAHGLTKGQPINITGSTDYDGPTRVVHIVSTTQFVIKKGFTRVGPTGSWDMKVVDGNWDAFMPLGANVTASDMAITYWRPEQQGGGDTGSFTRDTIYPIPGGIKRVSLGTAGNNVRLYRAASVRPGGLRNPTVPRVFGYNPTGAAVGATVDIIGENFDPALSNNEVRFYDGTTGTVAYPTSIDQEGHIITVVVPTGAGATGVVTVKTNGLATATGPNRP